LPFDEKCSTGKPSVLQVRIDSTPVVGISRDQKLAPPHAQQVVFPHQLETVHFWRRKFLGDARAPLGRPFQRNALDRVAQIHVAICAGLGLGS
jgi:hypothetical protein